MFSILIITFQAMNMDESQTNFGFFLLKKPSVGDTGSTCYFV